MRTKRSEVLQASQILTPNFCAWILSGFCSVREDKREAKTR